MEKKKIESLKYKINTFFKKDLENLVPVKLYEKSFLAHLNSELYLEQRYEKNWKTPGKKQFFWKKIND